MTSNILIQIGAECLAAGSSIMNRETESAQMRPLAKAVTKSLDHVRNLLREQCLRNKTPNSLTLNLDLNDAVTETLCESLKIFDRLFAEFELLYVSAMVQVKSKQEHEMQELICVLFSETLKRALRIGLLEQEQVDYYDPSLMFSIPRLAIVAGLVIYNKGPLNMSMPADQLSEMFRPFRTLLIKIRDLLRTLNANELYQLEKLLCTNEDIHIYASKDVDKPNESVVTEPVSSTELNTFDCYDSDDDDKFTESNSSSESTTSTVSRTSSNRSGSSSGSSTQSHSTAEIPSDRSIGSDIDRHIIDYTAIGSANMAAVSLYDETADRHSELNVWSSVTVPVPFTTNTAQLTEPATSTTHLLNASDSSEADASTLPNHSDWITTECASGYLVPNTNFGNLLQTTDTPLTDSFISSDDEYAQKSGRNLSNFDGDENEDVNGTGGSVASLHDITNSSSDARANENEINRIQTMINTVCIQHALPMAATTATTATAAESNDSLNRITVIRNNNDSGIGTAENTSSDQTPESEGGKSVATEPIDENIMCSNRIAHDYEVDVFPSQSTNAMVMRSEIDQSEQYVSYENEATVASESDQYNSNAFYQNYATSSYYNSTNHSEQYDDLSIEYTTQRPSTKLHGSRSHHSYRRERCERRGCTRKHSGNRSNSSGCQRRRSSRYHSVHDGEERVSISSTSCIYSDGDTQAIWQTSGRMKFK